MPDLDNKEVLLVYPGRLTPMFKFYTIPLSIVYVANALNRIGVGTRVFDLRKDKPRDLAVKDYLFVGISMMSGEMIPNGLKIAEIFKRENPRIPIVAGGVHPSLLPEQTLEDRAIDIVVVGEGEETVQELAASLAAGEDLSRVKGIAYRKENGEIVRTPPRAYLDLNGLDIALPYEDLGIDLREFAGASGFPINTSRGCPYRCGFCYNTQFNKRTYRFKGAERVVEEIEYVHRKYGAANIDLAAEDEFFINVDRVARICELLIHKDLRIKWSAFCRFNTFDRTDAGFLDLLKRSGCSLLVFGAESGSDRILNEIIRKDITVDQVERGVERLKTARLPHIVSFMCCLPTETDEDLDDTFDLIDRISKGNENLFLNGIFMFTPVPGTPLFDMVCEKFQYRSPASLREWGRYDMAEFPAEHITWCSRDHVRRCGVITRMSRHLFYGDSICTYGDYRKYLHNTITPYFTQYPFYLLARAERWRWEKKYFKYPVELSVYDVFNRFSPLLLKAVNGTRSLARGLGRRGTP